MWTIKEFSTREQMSQFIDQNKGHIQWQEVFINNAYGIEYRFLRII